MGQGINSATHDVTSFLKTSINGLQGSYYGEILKENKVPSGRGVFRADDGQVFIRNFEQGAIGAGSSIYLDRNAGIAGTFITVKSNEDN